MMFAKFLVGGRKGGRFLSPAVLKRLLVLSWLSLILAVIAWLFWKNEIRYTLPTPVPQNYRPAQKGERIALGLARPGDKPLFIHFFNPDCPCSKFNVPHVRSLMREYKEQVDFAVVVLSSKRFSKKEIQDKFGEQVPVYFDKKIAERCGVYSTPQAVLLDQNQALYYRGNYNKSRYCTDVRSNYAKQAIDSFLAKNTDPLFNQYALTAYGCELPNCRK